MATTTRICRTRDEAFQAGWDEPCPHGHAPPECEHCRLTPEEITRIAALLRIGLRDAA